MKTYCPYLSPQPSETGDVLRDFLWREFELSRMCFGWLPSFATWEEKWWSGPAWLLACAPREAPGVTGSGSSLRLVPTSAAGRPPSCAKPARAFRLAPSERAFWTGYRFLLQGLHRDYDAFLGVADPVTNSPTIDCLHHVLLERARILEWLTARPLVASTKDSGSVGGPGLRCGSPMPSRWNPPSTRSWTGTRAPGRRSPRGEPLGPLPVDGRSDPSDDPEHDYRSQLTEKEQASYEFYLDEKNSPVANNVRQMIFINSTEIIAANWSPTSITRAAASRSISTTTPPGTPGTRSAIPRWGCAA